VPSFGFALFLSALPGLALFLSSLSDLGLSALKCADTCAFATLVMLTSSRLSSMADKSPSTTLPPRSEEMESKQRE
jgi:hypothetical protein